MPAERSADKVKRPPNAWILFRSDIARSFAQQEELHPELPRRTQAQISKEISSLWNTLDPVRKAEYERRAEAKKHEHTLLYPDYRFQPMKKEEKERQKQLKKQKDREERYRQRNEPGASGSQLQSANASPAPQPASLPSTSVLPMLSASSTPIPYPQSAHSTPSIPQLTLTQSSQHSTSLELYGPSPPLCAAASPCDTTAFHADTQQALSLQPPALDLSATASAQSEPLHSVASPTPTTPWTPAMSEVDPVWNNPDHFPNSWQEALEHTTPVEPNTNFLQLDLPLPPQSTWPTDGEAQFDQNLQAIINSSGNPSIFHLDNIDTDLLNIGAPLDISLGDTGLDLSMFSYNDWADVLVDYLPSGNNNLTAPNVNALGNTFNDAHAPSNPPSSYAGEYEDNLNQFVDLDGTASSQHSPLPPPTQHSPLPPPTQHPPLPPPPSTHIPSPPSDHSSEASSSSRSSYAPPAAYSNQRRAGGTWKPPSLGEVAVQPWKVDVTNPSPDASTNTLAALSRNASVISTSSSDSAGETTTEYLSTPPRRPNRTFASPQSRSPSRPPAYIPKELPIASDSPKSRPTSKTRSKSRGGYAPTIDDFKIGETIGEASGQKVALKVLDKGHLRRKNKVSVARVEKAALVRLGSGHPGVIRMRSAFQDNWSLYFVLDLATNGEMQSLITRLGSLSSQCSQYYTAQLIDALAFIHDKGVIHRDVKPENLLLDNERRLKLTDFGTAKILDDAVEAERFVGTAQYVAPELLEANETSRSSDWWALGCILYQMIAGRFAFSGLSEYLTLQKVKQLDYSFPESFDEQAKDLVQKLLVRDPLKRLGAGEKGEENDVAALRSHSFLSGIDWENLWTGPAPPLEAGLVKREHPLAQGTDHNWEDVGATWDAMLQTGEPSDGIEWVPPSNGRQEQVIVRPDVFQGHTGSPVDLAIGPFGEVRTVEATLPDGSTLVSQSPRSALSAKDSPVSELSALQSPSSEAEDVEEVTQAMHALKRPTSRLPHDALISENERGRSKAMTPIQGNFPKLDLHSLLGLSQDESIVHRSSLEARSMRRRASRLLPIAGAQMKPKIRELFLTNRRLICVKTREKNPEDITIKSEFWLRPEKDKLALNGNGKDKDKEKDGRVPVSSVEVKGEREFVVLTPVKNYHYAARDAVDAARWVKELNSALSNRDSPSEAPVDDKDSE
ncbi:serine/threonine protein kinase [Marasmius crinis-equi]|uniref:non-specific serine/threonine protein kinase n=1 Tax=Marasmius crinis-equi TaxID=585013 RepID=A0ABR3FXR8_9AGAR